MKTLSLLLFFLFLSANAFSMGKKAPEGVSLLLVPAKPGMVQLGMDMASQNHALLMTYAETSPDRLFLHIWDKEKWIPVPPTSFETGAFIKNPASRMLIVGEENKLTASLIEFAMSWSPEVLHLGTTDITELLNQMGRLYGFSKKDWQWISSRYDLTLEDINRDRVQESWYDRNKASDLPPSEGPWGKSKEDTLSVPPETSLSPLMPPVEEKANEGLWLNDEFSESPMKYDPAVEKDEQSMDQPVVNDEDSE